MNFFFCVVCVPCSYFLRNETGKWNIEQRLEIEFSNNMTELRQTYEKTDNRNSKYDKQQFREKIAII